MAKKFSGRTALKNITVYIVCSVVYALLFMLIDHILGFIPVFSDTKENSIWYCLIIGFVTVALLMLIEKLRNRNRIRKE